MMENDLSILRNGITSENSNTVTSEEILNLIENLDDLEKLKLAKQLKAEINLILGGNNLVTNGAALQVNANADDIYKILEKVPPKAIGELSKAIGIYIAKKGC